MSIVSRCNMAALRAPNWSLNWMKRSNLWKITSWNIGGTMTLWNNGRMLTSWNNGNTATSWKNGRALTSLNTRNTMMLWSYGNKMISCCAKNILTFCGARNGLNLGKIDNICVAFSTSSSHLTKRHRSLETDAERLEYERRRLRQESKFNCSLPKRIPRRQFDLRPYLQCESVRDLKKMGVDLAYVEGSKKTCELLIKGSWKTDVKPTIDFLKQLGFRNESVIHIIQDGPFILLLKLYKLKRRLSVLRSYKFTDTDIVEMISRNPGLLCHKDYVIQQELQTLTDMFNLSDDEMRTAALKNPHIFTWPKADIELHKEHLSQTLGFSDEEMKIMFIRYPGLLTKDMDEIEKSCNYLTNQMQVSRDLIVEHSVILMTTELTLIRRHSFLKHKKLNQYNPSEPNCVSLAVFKGTDHTFCEAVNADLKEFKKFLKEKGDTDKKWPHPRYPGKAFYERCKQRRREIEKSVERSRKRKEYEEYL